MDPWYIGMSLVVVVVRVGVRVGNWRMIEGASLVAQVQCSTRRDRDAARGGGRASYRWR